MDDIDGPRIEHHDSFTVVGLSTRATSETDLGAHWVDFDARHDTYTGLTDTQEAFGVLFDFDVDTDSFTYIAGVEPSASATVPADVERVDVPGGTFAVFTTRIDEVGDVMDYIYDEWFPTSEFERSDRPVFEHYGPEFDPANPAATLEVYVPVEE
ncbi:GyrI-like domain-containing protein [Haloarchaeobius sp. TZWSO28]|uniref:GyrI-like domain-containing protein n=1 Tax=unclassified Haloarchaeobius TaxID=2614452 RepID=UPI003EBF4E92